MPAPTTLSELIALYLARCRIEGLSPRTRTRGIDRVLNLRSPLRNRFPRTRGDRPGAVAWMSLDSTVPPHARG